MSPVRRWTDGGVTVELVGDLEATILRMVEAAGGAALHVMEKAAEEVAASSRAQWYTLVKRKTGLSGDIQVVTTISKDVIKVSVGSTDTRTVEYKGKTIPLAAFVHEPGPLSLIHDKYVSHDAYWAAPEAFRGPEPKSGFPAELMKPNPQAAGGRKLLQILIVGPSKRLAVKLAPHLIPEHNAKIGAHNALKRAQRL